MLTTLFFPSANYIYIMFLFDKISYQDMVIQALQKTNNRSIEAAVEFISKMSYQDPRREQMAAAAARPINANMKPGDSLCGFFVCFLSLLLQNIVKHLNMSNLWS